MAIGTDLDTFTSAVLDTITDLGTEVEETSPSFASELDMHQ